MMQPKDRGVLSQQVARSRFSSIKSNHESSAQWARKVQGDTASATVHSDRDSFMNKSKMFNSSEQNIHMKKTFTLDSSLTVQEYNENDSDGSMRTRFVSSPNVTVLT